MSRNRPTLDDVARLAGVSGKTVARVVNREASVSDRTRARVEEAVARLGYEMNISARALASSRSYRIAVISPWISPYFITQIHQGAADACRARGYQLSIQKLDLSKPHALEYFGRSLNEQPVDGVLLPAPLSDHVELLDLLDERRIRYVRHTPLLDRSRSDSVFADEAPGIFQLVDHLWQIGHRRYGIVRGPDHLLASRLRSDAVAAAVAQRGRDAGVVSIFQMGTQSSLFAQGLEAARDLLSRAEPPSAIIAYNDEVAAGVIACAQSKGLRLPDDLAIAGHGDADFTLFTWPQLTTIHQPNAEMAAAAIEWLTSPKVEQPRSLEFPVRLVLRGSTARSGENRIYFGEARE